jgi:hypothetical protein
VERWGEKKKKEIKRKGRGPGGPDHAWADVAMQAHARRDRGVSLLAIPHSDGRPGKTEIGQGGLTGGMWRPATAGRGSGVPGAAQGGSVASSLAAAAPPGVLFPRSKLRPGGGCAGLRRPWAARRGSLGLGDEGEQGGGEMQRRRRRGRVPLVRHLRGDHAGVFRLREQQAEGRLYALRGSSGTGGKGGVE